MCNFKLGVSKPSPKEVFARRSEFHPRGQSVLPRFRSQAPTYSGGLLLLVALVDFLGILVSNVYVGYLHPELEDLMLTSSLFVGFFAFLTTIGGLMAVVRRYRRLCIALAVVTIIMHLLYGALLRLALSIVALIFIIQAKEEFD